MKKRWLILIAILIGIGLYAYPLVSGNFSSLYSTLNTIEKNNFVGDELLVPGDKAGLDKLEVELKSFKNGLDPGILGFLYPEKQALKLLVNSRIELIEMERRILSAKEKTSEAGFPDCGSGGNVDAAVQLLENAGNHAKAALEHRNNFEQNYPLQAMNIESDSTVFKESINAQIESISFVQSMVENACT